MICTPSRKCRAILALACCTTPLLARRAHASDLLDDDFNGGSLDTSKWNLGNWTLGRTQLGDAPAVGNGMASLELDVNHVNGSTDTFRGTEIYSKQTFARASGTAGVEFEARVRTNALPNGLVTSFFTYFANNNNPPLADEIDYEFLSNAINAANSANATYDPVLATTWHNYKTDGSNFGDPNVHSSVSENVQGLDTTQFNDIRIRWLNNSVQWWVNGVLIRTSTQAVPAMAMPIRANFWAPDGPGTFDYWADAYSADLNNLPTSKYYYNIDSISVRNVYNTVAATAPHRVFTDFFKNSVVENSDTSAGFWTQHNSAGSSIAENTLDPLKFSTGGAGTSQAQISSAVQSGFNLFESPISVEATGIDFSSTTNSNNKANLRFVLSSQALATNADAEATADDAISLKIGGDNSVNLGVKVNSPGVDANAGVDSIFTATQTGAVRHVFLVVHPTFYFLQVEHDTSATNSAQITNQYTGPLSLTLSDWNSGNGDSALYFESQLAGATAGETETTSVDSLAVNAIEPTWNINTGGDWNNINNWTDSAVPNYTGANAMLTNAIHAPQALSVNAPVILGHLTIDNTSTYTISGSSSITFSTPALAAKIDVLSGSHTIAVPVALNSNTTLNVANQTSVLSMTSDVTSAANVTLTKIGAGTLAAKDLRISGLTLNAGKVQIIPNGTFAATSRLQSLQFGGTLASPSATLDLTNNNLIIDYTAGNSPADNVRQLLKAGIANGLGIMSSSATSTTRLGYADNATLNLASFGGLTVGANSVLIKYTYAGDFNLDGKVDVTDLGMLASHWQSSGLWTAGDANYDGSIDVTDLGILASNWQAGVNNPLGQNSFQEALTALGLSSTFVPEPAMILLALPSLLTLRRRRSSRSER